MNALQIRPQIIELILSNVCDFLSHHGIEEPQEIDLERLRATFQGDRDCCVININGNNEHGAFNLIYEPMIDDTWRIAIRGSDYQELQDITKILKIYINAALDGRKIFAESRFVVGKAAYNAGRFGLLLSDRETIRVYRDSPMEREIPAYLIIRRDAEGHLTSDNDYAANWIEVQFSPADRLAMALLYPIKLLDFASPYTEV